MPHIRLRVKLNEGRHGAPLDKLGEIAREMDKFLRMLAHDVGLNIKKGELLTGNFKNGSVLFDVEAVGTAHEAKVTRYQQGLRYVSTFPHQPDGTQIYRPNPRSRSSVRTGTIAQFAKLGKLMDPDERLGFAWYGKRGIRKQDWRYLSKARASEIMEALEESVEYFGAIQGVIFSLHKESLPPYIAVKELSTDTLINCVYEPHQYNSIVHALKERDAVVHISGTITASRVDRSPTRMKISRLALADRLGSGDVERFFGCAPGLTGELSTSDFMDEIRSRAN